MKVLLTGANGNFGTEFLRQADFDVVSLNREDWETLEEKLSNNVDAVVHAASDLYTKASVSPVKLVNSNLLSTANLLEMAHKCKVSRFIFLSSCAVYGEDMSTAEDAPCLPVSLNGTSKLLNEKLISEFCSANGIKYEILRIFNMYGGNDHFSIMNHLKKSLENGSAFTLNNMGVAQRDFIHVTDVVAAVIHLLNKSDLPTYLNVGTGVATKISTIVELVRRRFPDLNIRYAQTREAEYSRADISKLRNYFDRDFIKIESYLESEFMQNFCINK